jgi:hypothetical protein
MGGRPLFMERESREIGPVGREKSHARRSFKKFLKVGRNSCAKTLLEVGILGNRRAESNSSFSFDVPSSNTPLDATS